jgi:hypothetical protein
MALLAGEQLRHRKHGERRQTGIRKTSSEAISRFQKPLSKGEEATCEVS